MRYVLKIHCIQDWTLPKVADIDGLIDECPEAEDGVIVDDFVWKFVLNSDIVFTLCVFKEDESVI